MGGPAGPGLEGIQAHLPCPLSLSRKRRNPRQQSLSQNRTSGKVRRKAAALPQSGAVAVSGVGSRSQFSFCLACFVLVTEPAGPSNTKPGRPEEASLDTREKRASPAPRGAGGLPRPPRAAWGPGPVTAQGLDSETASQQFVGPPRGTNKNSLIHPEPEPGGWQGPGHGCRASGVPVTPVLSAGPTRLLGLLVGRGHGTSVPEPCGPGFSVFHVHTQSQPSRHPPVGRVVRATWRWPRSQGASPETRHLSLKKIAFTPQTERHGH